MDVTFIFPLGAEVESREGVRGYVETLSISRGMDTNRVGVEYLSNEGKVEFHWFNEDDLTFVDEDE